MTQTGPAPSADLIQVQFISRQCAHGSRAAWALRLDGPGTGGLSPWGSECQVAPANPGAGCLVELQRAWHMWVQSTS